MIDSIDDTGTKQKKKKKKKKKKKEPRLICFNLGKMPNHFKIRISENILLVHFAE